MNAPKYTGSSLGSKPPFQFENVMTIVLPLRANMNALQRLCDRYLNIVPPEIGHFRPAAPYVHLMLLDYGKLAAPAKNFGWFAQRELLFSIPLEWYKWSTGRWVFHDWATVAPYIYVDSEMSMTTGRTVMGWPKRLINLKPELTGWLKNPEGEQIDLAFSARVFEPALGPIVSEQPVMEITSRGAGWLRWPPIGDAPFAPWNAWTTMVKTATALSRDAMQAMQSQLWMQPGQGSMADNALAKLGKVLRTTGQPAPWERGVVVNALNLKQFRLADRPEEYCYQALTNGEMRITSVNRGGLLGGLSAGPSGGFTIDIASWKAFPVVDMLGLEAEQRRSPTGVNMSRLHPVYPFWYDGDLRYENIRTLVSRSNVNRTWRTSEGPVISTRRARGDAFFNTTTGASSPIVTGPFRLPSASFAVFPLIARREACQTLLDRELNDALVGTPESFEVWAGSDEANSQELSYVYAVTMQVGPVGSETRERAELGELTAAYYIPVLRKQGGKVVGAGLFPAYTLADDTPLACTFSELYGIPATRGRFVKRAHAWDSLDDHQPRVLLEVSAESLGALHEGEESRRKPLLEFKQRAYGRMIAREDLTDLGEVFCRTLKAETMRKAALEPKETQMGRLRALELLALEAPLYLYTMKQFRSAEDPERACYQSLVQIPVIVQSLQTLEEIERISVVRVFERSSYPIVKTLGLLPRECMLVDGETVHALEAVRPFRFQASIRLENGRELYTRDGDWYRAATLDVRSAPPRAPRTSVIPTTYLPGDLEDQQRLERRISGHRFTELERAVTDWYLGGRYDRDSAYGRDARACHEFDLQAVIESILSREWSNREQTSRRLKAKRAQMSLGQRLHEGDVLGAITGLQTDPDDGTKAQVDIVKELAERIRWLEEFAARLSSIASGDADLRTLEHLRASKWLEDPARAERHWRASTLRAFQRLSDAFLPISQGLIDPRSAARLYQLARSLLEEMYAIAERRYEEVLDDRIFAARKPDHCLPRSTAGAASERLFPLQECWEYEWWTVARSGVRT